MMWFLQLRISNQRGMVVPALMALLLILVLGASFALRPPQSGSPDLNFVRERIDFRGAMFQVAMDVKRRHIKLEPETSHIYKFGHQSVLLKRSKNAQSVNNEAIAIYFAEGLTGVRSEYDIERMQLGFVDLSPNESSGVIQFGFWRKRPLRK